MNDLKAKVEAVLYCVQDGVDARKLASLCGIGSAGHLKPILNSLAEDYAKRGAGLEIVQENNKWKIKIKPQHGELVKAAAKPELQNAVLETLAFIAWKGHPTQSEVIKTRSSKAYDHLDELEKLNFVTKKKFKNTYRIIPTKKFYEYFQLKQGEKLQLPGVNETN